MNAKHTPGPWRAEGIEYVNGNCIRAAKVVSSTGRAIGYVGFCSGFPDGQEINPANAHLIAAAPEMYEALEDVTANCLHCSCRHGCSNVKVRSALAKARGEVIQ